MDEAHHSSRIRDLLVLAYLPRIRVYEANGVALAIGAFVALSLVYKFGASPMFAVTTSFLCFKYRAIGIWLPVLSYVLGSVLLYVDAKVDKLAREAGA